MRTKFVAAKGSEKFFEDAAVLADTPLDALTAVARVVEEATSAGELAEEDAIVAIAEQYHTTYPDLVRAMRAAFFILDGIDKSPDTPEAVAEDLKALAKIKDAEGFAHRVQLFGAQVRERLRIVNLRKSALSNTFPTIENFYAKVAYSFSFDEGFDPYKHKVDTYVPEIRAAVPNIVLNFTISRFGEKDRVLMASTLEEIDNIIAVLQAAKKSAAAVTTRYPPLDGPSGEKL